MKTLFSLLVLLSASAAWPCLNQISESRAIAAIAKVPGTSAGCVDGEPCLCFDGLDWETAVYADVTETYQEENPVWRAQLEQLERDGHLDDGSTVTTAPPMLTKTRTVKKLIEDAAKRIAKDARIAAEAQASATVAAARAARKARIQAADANSANTVAALKAIVKDLVDDAKDR